MSDENRIGDAPIEERYRQQMQDLAEVLDHVLNGDLRGKRRTTGFVLLVFPFGSSDGRCNYMSNGASRADIVTLMREQIARFEGRATDEPGHG